MDDGEFYAYLSGKSVPLKDIRLLQGKHVSFMIKHYLIASSPLTRLMVLGYFHHYIRHLNFYYIGFRMQHIVKLIGACMVITYALHILTCQLDSPTQKRRKNLVKVVLCSCDCAAVFGRTVF